MANTTRRRPTESVLDTFRRHVLSPLDVATDIVEEEQTEVAAERKAFEEFADRLKACEAEGEPRAIEKAPGLVRTESTADSMASIRTAYRETVMEVPHYDAVYGEPVLENVAAELGPDLAQCLDPENAISKTDAVMTALYQATSQAVQQRRAFTESLGEERDSIEQAKRKLAELVGEFDSPTIPDWYHEDFVERLDGIAKERQELLTSHPSPGVRDEATLCEYLYQDEPWTYPVLTGITRLRESVVLS